jgi:hypothetical protein
MNHSIPPCNPEHSIYSIAGPTGPLQSKQTKKSIDQAIERLIEDDDRFVEIVIQVLHGYQTEAEQRTRHTHEKNFAGFSAFDAPKFSRMAERLLEGERLSQSDLESCRHPMKNGMPRLAKYRRQLHQTYFEYLQASGNGRTIQ